MNIRGRLMYVRRVLQDVISKYLFRRKIIIVYGARQTGKTTLVDEIVGEMNRNYLLLNADNADVRALFTDLNVEKIRPVLGENSLVIIDEAQRIIDIGLGLKIIHDNFPDIQLIVTGSSAFQLADKITEPLTGRALEFTLYPFSFGEMVKEHGYLKEKRLLEHRLIFGYYPEIALNVGRESKQLKSLANSYLYKDLLMLESIKKPVLLEKILKALALQLGNEVSYNELSRLVGCDKQTVEKYIDLLEKAYIVFKISGFSRNLRTEIRKSKKIYFYDVGIRNAILANYQPIESRTDLGALWENFVISERVKKLSYTDSDAKSYFWRTAQQQEIDYVEVEGNKIRAYEIKWNAGKKVNFPKTFARVYPEASFEVITPENFYDFIEGQ